MRAVNDSLSSHLTLPFQHSLELVKRLFYVFAGERNMLQSFDVAEPFDSLLD